MRVEDLQATASEVVFYNLVGRGALIKPWIFTEIKEKRLWDISGSERLDLLKDFAHYGLEHWGSDERGVENTRRFLLEYLSYSHRYVPVGLLEVLPPDLRWRPPPYFGRAAIEPRLASEDPSEWIALTEMFLGKAPPGYSFQPKHKSNSYSKGGTKGWVSGI